MVASAQFLFIFHELTFNLMTENLFILEMSLCQLTKVFTMYVVILPECLWSGSANFFIGSLFPIIDGRSRVISPIEELPRDF